MIISDIKKDPSGTSAPSLDRPSTSTISPPSFEESTGIHAPNYSSQFGSSDLFIPQGGEEPPPEFTPYEAEFFVSGDSGDIVSHDRHLNQDGEALYRFLLSHSQIPPTVCLHLHGTHTESRTRTVTRRDSRGDYRTHHEHYTEDVVDFDFSIDVGQHIASGPVHWSLPDEEPAYRGKMVKEVETFIRNSTSDLEDGLPVTDRRKATSKEKKHAEVVQKEKKARGLPPWAALDDAPDVRNAEVPPHQLHVLKSSRTLRQWADMYCASDKKLKEFTYEKIVYGWHLANLEAAVSAAVKSTYYTGRFTVDFRTTNSKICIRPDNRLSRMLSNKWLKLLLIILLIYPFIWLYKRFGKRGGGRWEVCGGAYALKTWQLVDLSSEPPPPSFPPPPFAGIHRDALDTRTMQTQSGLAKLVGLREGEWFQQWEGTIRRAVTGRLKSTVPLKEPDERPTEAALLLDGYRPT